MEKEATPAVSDTTEEKDDEAVDEVGVSEEVEYVSQTDEGVDNMTTKMVKVDIEDKLADSEFTKKEKDYEAMEGVVEKAETVLVIDNESEEDGEKEDNFSCTRQIAAQCGRLATIKPDFW